MGEGQSPGASGVYGLVTRDRRGATFSRLGRRGTVLYRYFSYRLAFHGLFTIYSLTKAY